MAEHSVRIRLSDIREEIAGIRNLTKDADAQTFASSWAMPRAVRRAVAKGHGLGNLLRHEYRGIDPIVLWSIVTEHLDSLDRSAENLLSSTS
ncbi:HepT-like ribonuclease domain-containing protein [Pseudorhodoplanes sp.]|uniref:HepT-like ribonuclease domain-containing protein n=1 Tax=Pseudorhodoplanes sp. TaxID=1934341 RepID=UPI003D152361